MGIKSLTYCGLTAVITFVHNFGCKSESPLRPIPTLVKREMILFSSNRTGNHNVFIMTPDGRNIYQLTHYSEGDYWPADVSADGKHLLFYRFDDRTLVAGVFVMPIHGPEPTTPLDYGTVSGFFPDGMHFAYTSYVLTDTSGYSTIRIYSLLDSSSTQLTPQDVACYHPSVSRNGHWISFISWRPVGSTHQQLFIMKSDGTDERALTPATLGRYAQRGRFTQDNTKIIFTFNDGGSSYDLYWVSPHGGDLVAITTGHSNANYNPCPDSSGSRIYYRSGLRNEAELFCINLDGTNPKRLTHNQFVDDCPIVRVVEFIEY